ncbi:transmembrane amino acid transporter family protein [Medicago truncatula]|uniref:Transmembrane amino acid transporter family protein n=1 Tax=Medicago truncatula TaxID=3880 RepID=G7J2G8_MEDTR|nr:transmembrane amino acid transporter family protein [Medicago truncatula]
MVIIAISVPFFGSLLGFLGGFALAPTSYFLPCIIWLKLKKPKKFGLSWTINWICIVIGVMIMTLSPIGAMRNIIVQAKSYKFFS